MLRDSGNALRPAERELSEVCINFATAPSCASTRVGSRFHAHSQGSGEMRNLVLITGALATVVAGTVYAKGPPAGGTPAAMQKLLDCRSIQDGAQRLACYDREATTVDQAINKRDIVLIDKARATQAKRSLFGFSIPNFGGL